MRLERTAHPCPTPAGQRSQLLAAPGFGRVFTDHMVTIAWSRARGWHDGRVSPYRPIPLDPAAAALQYGGTIFEGLKVYRHPDGSLAAFRAANAARFRGSARRMGMPEVPERLFLDAITGLLAADHHWVTAAGGEESLYLRPFLIATTPSLVPTAAEDYLFALIASPAGACFPRGLAPVRA